MDKGKDKKEENSGVIDSVIGATTTENVERYGRAAAEYLKGYSGEVGENGEVIRKGLKHIAGAKVNSKFKYQNLKQQAGFSAELHYVSKTNAENIINGKSKRVARSNDVGLGNHTKYDVLSVDNNGNPVIIPNGEPLWSAQMKFCGNYKSEDEIKESSKKLVKNLVGKKWDKYRGNKVLVPSEQVKIAKEYAENEARNLTEKAKELYKKGYIEKAKALESQAKKYRQAAKDITDSGISSKEAMFLREHPKLATAKYVAKTAHSSGVEQAKAAAVMSSVISTSRNIVSVVNGEKEISDALKDVALDTAKGSATAYIIGASDTAIRGFMASGKNSIFQNLSKTNVPATIATVTVQVGKSLVRYANGEIDGVELMEELGEKGTGMMAASWGAAIGTAIFPGVGTAIGGMIGYMTSSSLYGAAMGVLREERLSEEKRVKIHALAKAAIESMDIQRKELAKSIEEFYSNRQEVFENSLKDIEIAIKYDDLDKFTKSLNSIALEMGAVLKFKDFQEFDDFMMDNEMSLDF